MGALAGPSSVSSGRSLLATRCLPACVWYPTSSWHGPKSTEPRTPAERPRLTWRPSPVVMGDAPMASTVGLQALIHPTGVSSRGPALAKVKGLATALQSSLRPHGSFQGGQWRMQSGRALVPPEHQVNAAGSKAPAALEASGGAERDRQNPWEPQSWRKGTALGQLLSCATISSSHTVGFSPHKLERPVFILSSPAHISF